MFAQEIRRLHRDDCSNVMIVSPDVGGVVRARAVAKAIEVDLAIIDKRRPKAGVAEVMNVIGEVDGKHCVLIDDIVDTAGTLCKAADALVKNGAVSVSAFATHGVLSGPAVANIDASTISEVVVTDSIQPSDAVVACEKIRAMTTAELLGEAIRRVSNEESVSTLFNM
jgi:ribose-phosphate pyrophosphokinase